MQRLQRCTRERAYPGNLEVCDRVDNDCSSGGGVDSSEDSDFDGFAPVALACAGRGEAGAPGTALPRTDCDDTDSATHPGAVESCDGLDFDCSSGGGVALDEDADRDNHAPIGGSCLGRGEIGASGAAYPEDDCDDTRATVYPGQPASADTDSCDGLDQDCNPATTELARTSNCVARGGGYCAPGGQCVRASRVIDVGVGLGNTCALMGNGTVQCWGVNSYGELGDGSSTTRNVPGPVPGLSNVAHLDSGLHHSCVVLNDSTARCWGANYTGQLGDNTLTNNSTPVAVVGSSGTGTMTGLAELGLGADHSCARTSDGNAVCWGLRSHVPQPIAGLTDVITLAGGYDAACATVRDGTARCWTNTAAPSIVAGIDTAVQVAMPLDFQQSDYRLAAGTIRVAGATSDAVGFSRVVDLAAGRLGVCAADDTGVVRCDSSSTVSPVPGLIDAVSIDAGSDTTCAPRRDGSLRCWDAFTTQNFFPAPLGVGAGGQHSCAILGDSGVVCWGDNTYGQVGNTVGGVVTNPQRVIGLANVVAISLGTRQSCALLTDTSVRCWGTMYATGGSGTPMDLAVRNVVQVDAGDSHTCVLFSDSTFGCVGSDTSGQIGTGTRSGAQGVTAGGAHTCAWFDDGSVWCRGRNAEYQLGDTTSGGSTLRQVMGLTAVANASAGMNHTCAVTRDGRVFCWGSNDQQQVGVPTPTRIAMPTEVPGVTGAVSVSAGDSFTCARLANGSVQCWGQNFAPATVPIPAGASQLSSGGYHACALLGSGDLWCWGSNVLAQPPVFMWNL